MGDKASEMRDSMRDVTSHGVEQARDAYNQFMDASRKAQESITQAGGAMATSALDVQRALMKFSEENMQAGFDFAARLAQARDLNEAMSLQADYTRGRVQAYSAQAQELTRLVSEAASKAKPNF